MFNTLEEFIEEAFPTSTNVKCFHCCHSFSNRPLPMPFTINNNRFHVKFVFCSWECMKTYVAESNNSNKNYIFSLIQQFYKSITGHTKKINFAPPRMALSDFGGILSIDEFRKDNDSTYRQIDFPFIVSNPKIDKIDNFSFIKEESAKSSFSKSQRGGSIVRSKDDSVPLSLERPKSNKKGSLADSMGLLKV